MRKLISLTAALAFVAFGAIAQSEVVQSAQAALVNAGVNIELPDDTTDEQAAQILNITGNESLNATQMEDEVKKVLGM